MTFRVCISNRLIRTPSFDPTGNNVPPPYSPDPLLFVQVQPRHSIYLSSEHSGSFIIDATISHYFGSAYDTSSNEAIDFSKLLFTINVSESQQELVVNQVPLGTTDNLFEFPLALLGSPRMDAYTVVLTGVTSNSLQNFSATTSVFYLPEKTTGSVTKIDNLTGSLLFRGAGTNSFFEAVIPFGFYGDYGHYFAETTDNVQKYSDEGFNVLHLVTSFLDDGPVCNTASKTLIFIQWELRIEDF